MSNYKVTQICPACGKPFSFYPSIYPNGHRVYCSYACRKAGSRAIALCPVCGKEFWLYRNEAARRKCCSRRCAEQLKSQNSKGVPRPDLRGPQPERYRQVALMCEICGKPFSVQANEAKGRRFCSNACRYRWQETALAGANNRNWKGGDDPYYGPNWRAQQRNARYRDDYTCQRCGKTEQELSCKLDVHHVKPFQDFGSERHKEANALSNLVSLCRSCHLAVEHEQGTRPNPWDCYYRKHG